MRRLLPDAPKKKRAPREPRVNPKKRRERPRLSLAGFKDPARRPRYIVWTGVTILVLAAFVVVALGVTSTYWFCAESCHKVQDDSIIAYQKSTHSQVSCTACHYPVNTDPFTFVFHKIESLGEVYLTATEKYELPLNGESHVALEMTPDHCTQCHNLKTRPATPSRGVIIDHDVHTEAGVGCTVCHNRVAHNENFKLTLKDPTSGEPNKPHEQFMSMPACFRCHEQREGGRAPGACPACHTPVFQLKPASHREAGFYPEGHADLAQVEESRVASALKAEETSETVAAEPAVAEGEDEGFLGLAKVSSINECSTCHSEKFCTDCHGVPMPHPAEFKKGHGKLGNKNPESCERCHGDAARFCDECHHGTSMNIPYDGSTGPWRAQHPAAVRALGASRCFDCHDPTFCAHCHVSAITD